MKKFTVVIPYFEWFEKDTILEAAWSFTPHISLFRRLLVIGAVMRWAKIYGEFEKNDFYTVQVRYKTVFGTAHIKILPGIHR